MSDGPDLPLVQLSVTGDVFVSEGETNDGLTWKIYCEAMSTTEARCGVFLNRNRLADITVYSGFSLLKLLEECQEVCAALLWSGIRAKRLQNKYFAEE